MSSTIGARTRLQWVEIVIAIATAAVLAPLAFLGMMLGFSHLHDAFRATDGDVQHVLREEAWQFLRMGVGGLLGLAGLLILTVPLVQTLRAQRTLRLAGTLLALPGLYVAGEFLWFEIRTGNDTRDALFALGVCVLPAFIALQRIVLAWRRAGPESVVHF